MWGLGMDSPMLLFLDRQRLRGRAKAEFFGIPQQLLQHGCAQCIFWLRMQEHQVDATFQLCLWKVFAQFPFDQHPLAIGQDLAANL